MDRKIRVLHVAEAAGGVERYLETLFKYSKDKVENILVCSQNYDYEKLKTLADRVIVLKMAHGIGPSSDIKVEQTLRKIIKKLTPDIIYAHSSKAGALARIANLGLKTKLIYNPHGWAFNEVPNGLKGQIKHILFKKIEKVESPFADRIICISNFEKKTAIENKIASPAELRVIYNGIDFDEVKKEMEKKVNILIPEDSFVVGMVGRITETKAPDTFVKAAKIIKKKIKNAYFVIVGDGDLRSEIEKLIKQEGLEDSFHITGWVDDPVKYMNLMDVGMLLSRWEGFGLVLPEYMFANVPIVATNVGGIPDVIHDNQNGLLVEKDNCVEVSDAVIRLHDNLKLRRALVNKATLDVHKYDGKRVARKIEEVYKEIIYR